LPCITFTQEAITLEQFSFRPPLNGAMHWRSGHYLGHGATFGERKGFFCGDEVVAHIAWEFDGEGVRVEGCDGGLVVQMLYLVRALVSVVVC